MTPLQAIILGIIQGLTEFLPISSTAHLFLVPSLLGWNDPGAAFTAVIQWGTFFATVLYFRQDILRLLLAFFRDLFTGQPFRSQDARIAWMIGVGTIPLVVCGLLLEKWIDREFRSEYIIASTLIGLALVLMLAEWLAQRRQRATELEEMSWSQALVVGLAQALALVPGASRSGVTITGGLFAGLSRATAARYSFLLSLPAIFGAGLYKLIRQRRELFASGDDTLNIVLATVVSGLVGYAAIAFLIHYLRTRTTWIFIVYRIALGLVLLALLAAGVVKPRPAQEPPPQSTSSIWLNSR